MAKINNDLNGLNNEEIKKRLQEIKAQLKESKKESSKESNKAILSIFLSIAIAFGIISLFDYDNNGKIPLILDEEVNYQIGANFFDENGLYDVAKTTMYAQTVPVGDMKIYEKRTDNQGNILGVVMIEGDFSRSNFAEIYAAISSGATKDELVRLLQGVTYTPLTEDEYANINFKGKTITIEGLSYGFDPNEKVITKETRGEDTINTLKNFVMALPIGYILALLNAIINRKKSNSQNDIVVVDYKRLASEEKAYRKELNYRQKYENYRR